MYPMSIPTTTTTTTTTTITPPHPTPDSLTLQLFTSCMNSNINEMKLLIQQKANPNEYCNISHKYVDGLCLNRTFPSDAPNNSLFHAAVLSNDVETIDFVIELLGNYDDIINEIDLYGLNSLDISIKMGFFNSVQHLMENYNAKVFDIASSNCIIPSSNNNDRIIPFVVSSNNNDLIKYLLDHGIYKGVDLLIAIVQYYCKNIEISNGLFSTFKYLVEQSQCDPHLGMNQNHENQFEEDDDNEDQFKILKHIGKSNNIPLFDYLIDVVGIPYNNKLLHVIPITSWELFKHVIVKCNFDINNIPRFGDGYTISHTIMSSEKGTIIDKIEYCINEYGFKLDVNSCTQYDRTVLETALENGRLDLVRYLIESHNVSFFSTSHSEKSIFDCMQLPSDVLTQILSLEECDSEMIILLASKNLITPHINQLCELYSDSTPFTVAAKTRPIAIIQQLLQYNVSIPNIKTHKKLYLRLLYNAAINDDPNVLDYFLQQHNEELQPLSQLLPSIFDQTIHGKNELVAQLLFEKYNFKAISNPIHRIISVNHIRLKNAPKAYRFDPQYNRPLLHYLINSNYFNINKNFQYSHTTHTAISLMANSHPCYNVDDFKCLINNGATINPGQSIFHHLFLSNPPVSQVSASIVNYFIQIGIDVNTNTIGLRNNTILHHLATVESHFEVFHSLVNNHQVNINIQNTDSFTPLHSFIASRHNHFKSIKYLLQHHPNLELVTKEGYTPLLYAIMHCKYNYTRLLIKYNANIYATTIYGSNIIHLCVKESGIAAAGLVSDDGAAEIIQIIIEKIINSDCDLL